MQKAKSLGLLFVVFAFCASLLGQNSATADLRGTVKDPNGAVITGATVTVRDAAKNFVRNTTTDAEGNYIVPLLPPGTYTVTVEAAGFSKLSANNVKVDIGQTAHLPFSLKIQAGSAEMTVNGEPELVEQDRTAVTETIGQKQIDNLPINQRDYLGFSLTTSTVNRDNGRPVGPAPTSGLNIGGTRGRSTLVQVDGADNTDTSINSARSTVSQEAVQEFQVVTNSYAAEYGRASGGVINVVTKSGNNNLHGSLFGFLRNRNFEATNHFSPVSQPPYTRAQYGATLGGPIKKDRTFFFLGFEQRRRQESGFFTSNVTNGLTSSVTLPTYPVPFVGLSAAQVAAVNQLFAISPGAATCYAFLAASASATALTGNNPYAGIGGGCGAYPAGVTVGQHFVLSGASITNVMSNDAAGNPLGYRGLLGLQKVFPLSEGTTFTSLRIDHKISVRHQLNMRFGYNPSKLSGIQVESQNQSLGQNDFSRTGRQGMHDLAYVAGVTSILSPSLVNDFHFNFGRRAAYFRSQVNDSVAVNISGSAFFGRELFSPVVRTESRYEFTDNVTKVMGNHTVRFGGDVAIVPIKATFELNFAGLFNFGDVQASNLGFPAFMPSFSPVQAYGLGLPSTYVQGFGNPKSALKNVPTAWFIQDSWKVRPTLTLNYGLRYDLEFTQHFKTTGVTDPFSGIVMSAADITSAQDAIGVQQGVPTDYRNIAPRLALAWDPFGDGKTVVRMAGGLFFDHPLQAVAFNSDIADSSQQQQGTLIGVTPNPSKPLNAVQVFQGTVIPGFTPGAAASAQYQPGRERFNDQTFPGFGPVLPFTLPVGKNFRYPYAEQANVTMEHQIGKNLSVSLGYLMVQAHHLNHPQDLNAPDAGLLTQNFQRLFGGPPPNTTAAEFFSLPTSAPGTTFVTPTGTWAVVIPGLLVQNTGTGQKVISPIAANFFRPTAPNYFFVQGITGGAVTPQVLNSLLAGSLRTPGVLSPFGAVDAQMSNANSNYHALTFEMKKRIAGNFQFMTSYTWSHAIDDGSDLQTLLLPQDNRKLKAEKADSLFDQRHRFVFSGVFVSPEHWRSGTNLFTRLLSDFTVAPILEISSGRPFNILTNTDTNGDQSNQTDRPNVGPGGVLVLPGTLQDGNLGRNKGLLPGYASLDMRVSRLVRVTERVNLNLIAEGFNLANRLNIASMSPFYTDVNSTGDMLSGGRYRSRSTAGFDPRQFQFGMKVQF